LSIPFFFFAVCFFPLPFKLFGTWKGEWGGVWGLFWQYAFYGFGGFLLESAFALVTRSPRLERKCHLLLPVCPVYGVGGLALGALPELSPWALLAAGAAVCTAAEWCLSVFYEKAAGTAFWDYSGQPGSVGGRICPMFSLFWGLLSLPVVLRLAPWVETWAAAVPGAVTVPWAVCYLADALVSLVLLRRGGRAALRWSLRPAAARRASR